MIGIFCKQVYRAGAQGQVNQETLPAMPLQGAKVVPLLLAVSLGLALRFLVPAPAGVTMQAWTLLSIFVSTIAGGCHGPCVGVGVWVWVGGGDASRVVGVEIEAQRA